MMMCMKCQKWVKWFELDDFSHCVECQDTRSLGEKMDDIILDALVPMIHGKVALFDCCNRLGIVRSDNTSLAVNLPENIAVQIQDFLHYRNPYHERKENVNAQNQV